jgi:sugar O-acyltransferase (sialic acid O-acetyltransferase NeuD family)
MKARVIVIGGADQGRQTIDIIEAISDAEIAGVLDRDTPDGDVISGYEVLGTDEDLPRAAAARDATAFVVAIGDNFARHVVLMRERARCPQLEPLRVTHPSAIIARSAEIGPGSIIMAGAVVSNACRVGAGALLGTRSSIDHDCVLGDCVSLAPGATTGGGVRIGECTAIGLGANVIHGVEIGKHNVVGAGALVLDDIAGGVVAYGAPARVARKREPDEPYLTRQ